MDNDGQITIDAELVKEGLSAEILRRAFNISDEELRGHRIEIQLVSQVKTKGSPKKTWWSMCAYLDDHLDGVVVGIAGYNRKLITITIHSLRAAAANPRQKPKGVWPKTDFIQWLQRRSDYLGQRSCQVPKRPENCRSAEQLRDCALRLVRFFQQANDGRMLQRYTELFSFWEKHHEQLSPEYRSVFERWRLLFDGYRRLQNIDFTVLVKSVEKCGDQLVLHAESGQPIARISQEGTAMQYQGQLIAPRALSRCYQKLHNCRKHMEQQQKIAELRTTMQQLPEQLLDQIAALQHKVRQHPQKIALLPYKERHFIENFGSDQLEADHYIDHRQTRQDLLEWIAECIQQVQRALTLDFQELELAAILGLIASTPKYGVTTYAMWLGKSKAKSLERKSLDNDYRGILHIYSIATIVERIENLVSNRVLEVISVGRHDLPVLRLTDHGRKLLATLNPPNAVKNVPEQPPPSPPPPPPKETEKIAYRNLFDAVSESRREAWIEFLNTPAAIEAMALWDERQISELYRLLNRMMPGWQAPARWQLVKHPRRYKPLGRLLELQTR